MSNRPATFDLPALRQVVEQHWGFREFRPLQERAMRAVLEGRDSVVVLPTGGGKSLCYQAPAVLRGDTTVVLSPLIALMKDQVDSLQACGVPAVQIDSSQSPEQRFVAEKMLVQGQVRLVFISPERLVTTEFHHLLRRANVRTFAIDEAHCISHWGHDFRPEYRQLTRIKELFPHASVHAYTATATEQVRKDMAAQLALVEPELLVGDFDRPNLTYRVLPRHDLTRQVLDVLSRHTGEAGIIYCPRRQDVDDLAALLRQRGFKALGYHAGMQLEDRTRTQEAFAAEEVDLIVATVAFGMGIDRSNIRFVLHTAMPKALEHYQQETGRAGRDSLEAECVLLHSGGDFLSWKSRMEKSAEEQQMDPSFLAGAMRHLEDIDRYCRGVLCRHRALVEYFGQQYVKETCGACDLCLGDTAEVRDALVVAQKILSCVARVQERFGIGHVISVLRGESNDKVTKFGHDKLSTYGLLHDRTKADLRDWVYQLISQKVLVQNELTLPSGDKVPLLGLNAASWEVMRGQRQVRLLQLVRRKKGQKAEKSQAEQVSWEGVDQGLFEALRERRRRLAAELGKPPYVIFGDATLRELARKRPVALENMRGIYGIGDNKLREFGQIFLDVLQGYSPKQAPERDETREKPTARSRPAATPDDARKTTFVLFEQGATIDEVSRRTGQARPALVEQLCAYIRAARPLKLTPWVADAVYERVAAAARQLGEEVKPLQLRLGAGVTPEAIRLVVTHMKVMEPEE
jgi:ATP-dependent DNA helicase RecQ